MNLDAEPTQDCYACGQEMKYQKQDHIVRYKDQSRTIKLLAWWCQYCGEGILSGKNLKRSEMAFVSLRDEVERTHRNTVPCIVCKAKYYPGVNDDPNRPRDSFGKLFPISRADYKGYCSMSCQRKDRSK